MPYGIAAFWLIAFYCIFGLTLLIVGLVAVAIYYLFAK